MKRFPSATLKAMALEIERLTRLRQGDRYETRRLRRDIDALEGELADHAAREELNPTRVKAEAQEDEVALSDRVRDLERDLAVCRETMKGLRAELDRVSSGIEGNGYQITLKKVGNRYASDAVLLGVNVGGSEATKASHAQMLAFMALARAAVDATREVETLKASVEVARAGLAQDLIQQRDSLQAELNTLREDYKRVFDKLKRFENDAFGALRRLAELRRGTKVWDRRPDGREFVGGPLSMPCPPPPEIAKGVEKLISEVENVDAGARPQ